MLTIASDFLTRISNKDTRKLILCHLYYDESNFLPIATVATVVGSTQYLGIINDVSGISQKWNIVSDNKVTLSTPTITLINYNTPGYQDIMDEFNTHTYYGRQLKIYIGYEGQTLANMINIYDGIIEDIAFKNGKIEITGKTYSFSDTNISGRKINYDEQKIGDDSIPEGYSISETNDNKLLPVLFGEHWCAPMQPYIHADTRTLGKSDIQYYSVNDNQYSTLIKDVNQIKSNIYNYNINTTTSLILLENDEYYVPLYSQDWYAPTGTTYSLVTPDNDFTPGIKLPGVSSNYHVRNDGNIFLTIPYRYDMATDQANYFTASGVTSTDTQTEFAYVLDPTSHAENPFYLYHEWPYSLNMWVKLRLDVSKNLKSDKNAHIRKTRKIHILSTDSADGGQGYCLGRYDIEVGGFNYEGGSQWMDEIYRPVRLYHFANNYIPSDVATFEDDIANYNNLVGGSDFGFLPFEGDDLSGWSGNFLDYIFNYNYNARVFYLDMGYNYDNVFDAQATPKTFNLGRQGTHNITENMGLAPFINRDTFVRGDTLGCMLHMILPSPFYEHELSNEYVRFYKLYGLSAGSISLDEESLVYGAATGMMLDSSNSLTSTPQTTDDYSLKRPYEYLEFLVKEKDTDLTIGSEFSTVSGLWNSFFGTTRDGSGFSITEEKKLNEFVTEYTSNEPFTIYPSEDGTVHFKMLKRTYSDGDEDDIVDFNDFTDFELYMTESEKICSEIKHLKTGYQYTLETYTEDINWRLVSGLYDYGFWKANNTADNNKLFIEKLEKEYTSYTEVDIVTYGGKHWGCIRTNTNQTPAANSLYWRELASAVATNAWSNSTEYKGEDAENREIAKYYLNQWANRHRMVKFSTKSLEYLKYLIGDVIQFTNVPYTLLGLDIKGFNGSSSFTTTVNGQTVYAVFIITNIQKDLDRITIEAMQLHNLNSYTVERIN